MPRMKSNGGTFATAINCIDGRAQDAVKDWAKKQFGVDWIDTITEPGIDGLFAKDTKDTPLLREIKRKALISAEKHGSSQLVIAGHFDCAGNPVDEATHKEHIRKAVMELDSWNIFEGVTGLWVNEKWKVEIVHS